MNQKEAYADFIKRLTHLISKNPRLINNTLSNIFTMRLIGNKTHGDLAEIGISEFVNQFMYDFKSTHVGKDKYRAKEHEEDIEIRNEIQNIDFTISLKAYGHGPLQLSTDKNSLMFSELTRGPENVIGHENVVLVLDAPAFSEFGNINVLPLIYDEPHKRCNIMVFDFDRARKEVHRIKYEPPGRGRKHPVYRFYNAHDGYICEVRYGGASANALQRGLWTHTKHAVQYFNSVTAGWVDYSENPLLVELFAHALVSTRKGHDTALAMLKTDIEEQKRQSHLEDK
jgi:hypothetical protein